MAFYRASGGASASALTDTKTATLGDYLVNRTRTNEITVTAQKASKLYASASAVGGRAQGSVIVHLSISVNGNVIDSHSSTYSAEFAKDVIVNGIDVNAGDVIVVHSDFVNNSSSWSIGGATVSYTLV